MTVHAAPTVTDALADFLRDAGLACAPAGRDLRVESRRARSRREARLEITAALSAWHRHGTGAVTVLDLA